MHRSEHLQDRDQIVALKREVAKLTDELRQAREYQHEVPGCHICGHDQEKSQFCSRCRPGWCLGCLNREIRDLKEKVLEAFQEGFDLAKEHAHGERLLDSRRIRYTTDVLWDDADKAFEEKLAVLKPVVNLGGVPAHEYGCACTMCDGNGGSRED